MLTPALAAAAPGWGTGLWPGPRAGSPGGVKINVQMILGAR